MHILTLSRFMSALSKSISSVAFKSALKLCDKIHVNISLTKTTRKHAQFQSTELILLRFGYTLVVYELR